MAWATIEQVEDHLGVPSDARMDEALAVSESYCQRQRPDLSKTADPGPAVTMAVVLYAGLLYRQRSSPAASYYDEMGGTDMETATAMTNIYRLLGNRKPVAR